MALIVSAKAARLHVVRTPVTLAGPIASCCMPHAISLSPAQQCGSAGVGATVWTFTMLLNPDTHCVHRFFRMDGDLWILAKLPAASTAQCSPEREWNS